MVSVDTNVLVRLITNDDAEQVAASRHLFNTNEIYIPMSVILETEWVLRFSYQLDREMIQKALTILFSMKNVTLEDGSRLQETLHLYEKGLDFADALHLASSSTAESLATFDRRFCECGKGLTSCEPYIPAKPD